MSDYAVVLTECVSQNNFFLFLVLVQLMPTNSIYYSFTLSLIIDLSLRYLSTINIMNMSLRYNNLDKCEKHNHLTYDNDRYKNYLILLHILKSLCSCSFSQQVFLTFTIIVFFLVKQKNDSR